MSAEPTLVLPLTLFTTWLANGERGLSSEVIVSRITGVQVGRRPRHGDHPWDLDDFRRCELLFREVPLARLALPQMADVSETWARLVEAWDEIVELTEREAPEFFKRRGYSRGGSALGGQRLRTALGRAA